METKHAGCFLRRSALPSCWCWCYCLLVLFWCCIPAAELLVVYLHQLSPRRATVSSILAAKWRATPLTRQARRRGAAQPRACLRPRCCWRPALSSTNSHGEIRQIDPYLQRNPRCFSSGSLRSISNSPPSTYGIVRQVSRSSRTAVAPIDRTDPVSWKPEKQSSRVGLAVHFFI